MVRTLGSKTDAGPVVEPEPALLRLLPRNFEPFAPPDPLDPLVVHVPPSVVQHPGHHAVAVAHMTARQLDDVFGQPRFVGQAARNLALCGSVLPQCAAGAALARHCPRTNGGQRLAAERLPRIVDASPAARRAQKFPRAASARIILSRVRSDTARRSHGSPPPAPSAASVGPGSCRPSPLSLGPMARQSSVLAPSVVGVLRHADLPNRVGDRPALALQNLNLPQLQHDLLGLVSSACHPQVLLKSG